MRAFVFGVLMLAVVGVASANILLNPGFEIGNAGGGAVASNWWAYNNCGTEPWANRTGSNGMAFWSWDNGAYGGFGQDVSTNLFATDVLTFSIYGLAQDQFESTESETWLAIEYWTNGASTWTRQDKLDVYSGLIGDRNNWNQYTLITTVNLENVEMVKPIVGGGAFTNNGIAGDRAVMWDDSDFTVTNAIPEPTVAGLLGLAGLLICALRRARK